MTAAASGFFLGLQLILAIGAQNAFVLRQGIRREHVFWVVLTCAVSDAALIALGVSSFATVAEIFPALEPIFVIGGALFLIWYGIKHLRLAFAGGGVLEPGAAATGLRAALMTCLALTWLNPHVYLDTVILLGSLSAGFPGARLEFALGAMASSFAFFFSLGFGARYLQPFFATPRAWQVLDAFVGLTMFFIAGTLLLR